MDPRASHLTMDGDLRITSRVVIAAHELQWKFSRSGGPGGQSVNTTDSRVQLIFDLINSPSIPEHFKQRAAGNLRNRLQDGVLTITASEHRSQLKNRKEAERRLADILREAMAPPPAKRRATKPTKSSIDKRIKEKKVRGDTKRLRRANRDD